MVSGNSIIPTVSSRGLPWFGSLSISHRRRGELRTEQISPMYLGNIAELSICSSVSCHRRFRFDYHNTREEGRMRSHVKGTQKMREGAKPPNKLINPADTKREPPNICLKDEVTKCSAIRFTSRYSNFSALM